MSHDEAMKIIAHNEEEFEVKERDGLGNYMIMRVQYPHCPNGDKIMVFRKDISPSENAKSINPHFGRDDSPCARFEPTDEGWQMAWIFVNSLIQADILEGFSSIGEFADFLVLDQKFSQDLQEARNENS